MTYKDINDVVLLHLDDVALWHIEAVVYHSLHVSLYTICIKGAGFSVNVLVLWVILIFPFAFHALHIDILPYSFVLIDYCLELSQMLLPSITFILHPFWYSTIGSCAVCPGTVCCIAFFQYTFCCFTTLFNTFFRIEYWGARRILRSVQRLMSFVGSVTLCLSVTCQLYRFWRFKLSLQGL